MFNAELKEVAYLDAISWIVHDSGLWFLGRQERVYHAGLRQEGVGRDPNSTTSMIGLHYCHDCLTLENYAFEFLELILCIQRPQNVFWHLFYITF